jgi:hypothetical protein
MLCNFYAYLKIFFLRFIFFLPPFPPMPFSPQPNKGLRKCFVAFGVCAFVPSYTHSYLQYVKLKYACVSGGVLRF